MYEKASLLGLTFFCTLCFFVSAHGGCAGDGELEDIPLSLTGGLVYAALVILPKPVVLCPIERELGTQARLQVSACFARQELVFLPFSPGTNLARAAPVIVRDPVLIQPLGGESATQARLLCFFLLVLFLFSLCLRMAHWFAGCRVGFRDRAPDLEEIPFSPLHTAVYAAPVVVGDPALVTGGEPQARLLVVNLGSLGAGCVPA